MASNQQIIHITTQTDLSEFSKSIAKMRQLLGSIGVDSTIFSGVDKDLINLEKKIQKVSITLKTGFTLSESKGLQKNITDISRELVSVANKFKTLKVEMKDVKFDDKVSNRLEQIALEIDKINAKTKDMAGKDLLTAIKNAVPKDLLSEKFFQDLKDGKAGLKDLSKEIEKVSNAFEKVKSGKNLIGTLTTLSANKSNSTLSTLASGALQSIQQNSTIDSKSIQEAMFKGQIDTKTQDSLNAAIKNYNDLLSRSISLKEAETQVTRIYNNTQRDLEIEYKKIEILSQEGSQLQTQGYDNAKNALVRLTEQMQKTSNVGTTNMNKVGESVKKTTENIQRQDSVLKQLATRASMLIGINAIFNYITRAVRSAWNSIKELDKEFTQIAVVTDKTTAQLWQSYSTYASMAQKLGVATKDAVATSALYYQQGLKTADVMSLTAETIKMAQIAGMDFATATNQMTAALRGFNMEMSQANTVNDIFSTLAANAAVSTQELAYALTKTASIAESAGMSIETTSAFLTKMIETTREAPKQKLAA